MSTPKPVHYRLTITPDLERFTFSATAVILVAADQPVTQVCFHALELTVRAMMESWIGQPGLPLVTVRREGNELILEQERFTYLPGSRGQHWMIPVIVSTADDRGRQARHAFLMEGARTRVALEGKTRAYKLNAGQSGFYRVRYDDPENLRRLGDMVRDRSLVPEDRWGLEQDLFALVESGGVPLDDYLGFLDHYENEAGFLPLTGIAGNLQHAFLALGGEGRRKIAGRARALAERALGGLGLEPRPGEDHGAAVLRDRLLWQAVFHGSESVGAFARERFQALRGGRAVHPDIRKSVLQAGAFWGAGDTFEWFTARLREARNEHERMNLLEALGCFRGEALVRRVQDYILAEVPDRNRFIPVTALCRNPFAVDTMWDWYLKRIDDLERSHPLLYERVVAAVIPACGLGNPGAVKAFFETYVQRCPQVKDVVGLSLERLEIRLRMRRREGGEKA